MQSDEQLMLDFKKGSTQAFEQLFQRYRNLIYGFFRRRLTDPGRAEEMAQETFVVILRGAERYEERAKFRTYVFSIALKMLWSERRKESRDEKFAAASEESSAQTDPADPVDAIWIRDALRRLDHDHREVLMLREYEQFSYEDIATALSIPVNTVRSRLSRARAELKSMLEARAIEGVSS